MPIHTIILITLLLLVALVILVQLIVVLYIWATDSRQKEHAVLRNFPVLGKMR